jgi:hypothetical protein
MIYSNAIEGEGVQHAEIIALRIAGGNVARRIRGCNGEIRGRK